MFPALKTVKPDVPETENKVLGKLWSNMPMEAGPVGQNPGVRINARDLVPADSAYYRYMGSLTPPPCSEGVNWYVLKTPIQVGKKQIKAIADIMGANNRPTQGLANRLLVGAQ